MHTSQKNRSYAVISQTAAFCGWSVGGASMRGLWTRPICTQPAMRVAQRLYETTGFSRTPDLDFQPVPGLTLRAYELALPRIRG